MFLFRLKNENKMNLLHRYQTNGVKADIEHQIKITLQCKFIVNVQL